MSAEREKHRLLDARDWARAARKPPVAMGPGAELWRLRRGCLGTEVGRALQAEETAWWTEGLGAKASQVQAGAGEEDRVWRPY